MSITKVKDVVLPALEKFWAKIEIKINELNEKFENFNEAKSRIISSSLGSALGMTTDTTIDDVATNIEGVAVCSNNKIASTYDLDTTNKRLRFYIPKTGYFNASNFIYQSYSNIANLIGLTATKMVAGNTVLGIDGADKGYDLGYEEGVASLEMQTITIEEKLNPPYTYTYQISVAGTYVFIFAGPVMFTDTDMSDWTTTISYGSTAIDLQSNYATCLSGVYGGACVVTKPKVCSAGVSILLRHTGLATSGSPSGNARFVAVRLV